MSLRKIRKTIHRHLQLDRFVPADQERTDCCGFSSRWSTLALTGLESGSSYENHAMSHSAAATVEESMHAPGVTAISRPVRLDELRYHHRHQNHHQQEEQQRKRASPCSHSSPSMDNTRRWLPHFVSCFSPLDMPADLFVYLLQFMSSSELWRLCQVSRAMQLAVLKYMPRSQRLEFEIIRILRQENPNTRSQMHMLSHEMRYEAMASTNWINHSTHLQLHVPSPPPPSPPIAFSPAEAMPSRGVIRSRYWEAQSRHLLEALVDGTPYAHAVTTTSLTELELEAEKDEEDDETGDAASFSLVSPTLHVMGPPVPPRGIVPESTHGVGRPEPLPLPMAHFQAMINILFDPILVQLQHQRALINCARYITSGIERSFGKIIKTSGSLDKRQHSLLVKGFSVAIGPFLTLHTSHGMPVDAIHPPPMQESTTLGHIQPPRFLESYFQMMIWHRCLTDLVALFNRIQKLHTRPTITHARTALLSTRHSHHPAAPPVGQEPYSIYDYSFCCPAHSTSSANRQSYSTVPCDLGQNVRRAVCKFRCVTSRKGTSLPCSSSRRAVAPMVSNVKAHCCTGSSRPLKGESSREGPADTHKDPECQMQLLLEEDERQRARESDECQRRQERDIEEENLILRRFMMEERIRQDTLMKQELLSLCHTACGLFMIRSFRHRTESPPAKTIMTLLRQGSPWNKGVWREGEWRHAPIDLDHDADEVAMSRRLESEIKYRIERNSSQQRSPSAGESTIRERLRQLFNISAFHGREGEDDTVEQGTWQRLCLATIQFLADERLAWGGNEINVELSKLRSSSNASAWFYHE
ncbi:hypothetical protein BGZ68_002167 [Mortierella alpina]|nr:hypothetical protein BGZ68_002167 [Mortierella alpina]